MARHATRKLWRVARFRKAEQVLSHQIHERRVERFPARPHVPAVGDECRWELGSRRCGLRHDHHGQGNGVRRPSSVQQLRQSVQGGLGFLHPAQLLHQLLRLDQQANRHGVLGDHGTGFRLGARAAFFAFFLAFIADFTTLIVGPSRPSPRPSAVPRSPGQLSRLAFRAL